MYKIIKNDTMTNHKKILNKHFYISPKKVKFHGFNFLMTNIKNFGQKRDKITINRLLNSSKYMLRDNSKYKSCFDLSRNTHFYPYKPYFSLNINDKKYNFFSGSAENKNKKSSKILFNYNSLEENNGSPKINLLPRKKLTTPISPILSRKKIKIYKYSEDNINIANNFKIQENFFKNKKYVDNNNNYNIQLLLDNLKNISLDKDLLLNNEHLQKISYFNFDSLTLKVKLAGLKIKFYELTKKRNRSNITINNFRDNKISNIKFPFEFIYFFYGLNFDIFLVFLTKIIDYNNSKKSFELNYDNFLEKYDEYKSKFSFYSLDSYLEKYDSNNNKEYFKFNWDVHIENDNQKENNIIKNYLVKIILPKISISIRNNYNKNSIFYANIDNNQLFYFLRNNFLNWDQYILNYYSEFKLFRYVRNNLLSADKNAFDKVDVFNDNINFKDLTKVKYNLNKTNIILNNFKTNNKSYEFFFSKYKKENKSKYDNYFFQIKLPQINVNYIDHNISINKQFDLDINTMTKLNKLRKSFNRKDIIKYCLIFVKGKNNINRLSSMKKPNPNSDAITKKPSNKLLSKFSLKNNHIENTKHASKYQDNLNNEDVIDIKLNLNENIFNFDEDILKYIKVDEEKIKNNKLNEDCKIDTHIKEKYLFEDNQNKKLNIEIEKIQLYWINSNNIKNVYKFQDDESEYLFDHSSMVWREYIHKNFEKIISNSIPENKIVSMSVKNSSSSLKYIKK